MKCFFRFNITFVLVLVLGLSSIGLAEEKSKKTVLENIVVTATRTEIQEDDAPASVSVITKKDLDRLTFDRIDDAIRHEVGVYAGKLRGLPSGSQTLVMLNGMPLNSGWFGGIRWNNIAMENVEKIEIVRGPASALYGRNAMGGTINIITALSDTGEAGVQARVGCDSNLSYGGYVGSPIGEKFKFRLGFEIDQELSGYPTYYVQRTLKPGNGVISGGFYMPTRNGKPAWIAGDIGDRIDKQWSINLASAYEFSDTGQLRFDYQIGYELYDYGHPHTYLRGPNGKPIFDGRIDIGNGKYASVKMKNYLSGKGETLNSSYMFTYLETFNSLSFIGKLGYQHEDKYYTIPSPKAGQDYYTAQGNIKEFDADTYFTDLQFSFELGDSHFFTTGIYGRANTFTQNRYELGYYRDRHSKTTGVTQSTRGTDQYFAFYLQDEFDLIDDVLTLYAGARYDTWKASDGKSGNINNPTVLDDVSNSALSPKLSLVWNLKKDTIIRGSAGKAFRAPTIYDLYRTYESRPGRMVFSNPDLDPETIMNFEVGITQYLNRRMIKLGATVFYSDIENLIYSYTASDGNSYKDNAGEAHIEGIEFAASVIPWDFLSLWTNFTYNNAKITQQDKDPKMEGKQITSMPDRTINAGADFIYEWFKASLSGQYTGRIYKSKYNTDISDVFKAQSQTWLWNTKLSAELPFRSDYFKSFEVSFSVENLFDTEYYNYFIGRGRNYFVGVKMTW